MAGTKHIQLRGLLTDAIVELCRREAFYVEELRIEGTVCLVSDGSSVLIAQITEQIGEKPTDSASLELPLLDTNDAENGEENDQDRDSASRHNDSTEDRTQKIQSTSKLTIFPQRKMKGMKYLCSFCPKKYRFKHSLKDHLNKHMGRKPHVCKHCQASFTHLASLCSHMKKCHSQHLPAEHWCRLCGERYLNAPSLQEHIALKHKDNNDESSLRKLPALIDVSEAAGDAGEDMEVTETMREPAETGVNEDSFQQYVDAAETQQDTPSEDQMQLVQPKQEVIDDPEPGEIAHHETDHIDVKPQHMQFAPTLDPSKAIPVSEEMQNFLGSFPQQGMPMIPTMEQLMRSLPHGAALMPGMHSSLPYQAFTSSAAMTKSTSPISTSPFASPSKMTPSRNQEFQRTPEGKFKCPYCEKAYNFKHTLKDHINKHTGRRPHVCKHCGDSFAHLASLCAHIKRRHDEQISNDFLCEICQEKFMNYQSLKQHYTWRHKSMKVPIKLPTSSSTSSQAPRAPVSSTTAATNAESLSKNVAEFNLPPMNTQWDLSTMTPSAPVFPGQAPINSEALNNSPSEPSYQGNHSLLGTGEGKPELEEDPDLSYLAGLSLPGELTTPEIEDMGSGESGAREGASQVSGLPRSIAMYFDEITMQTDQGQYRYKCKMCGNLFKVRNSLYEHLNSHFGKRPHVCPYCGDSFAHHSSLHNHVRNRHTFMSREEKEATFKHQCVTCGKKFRYPSELDRHMKTNPDHVAGSATPSPGPNESQQIPPM